MSCTYIYWHKGSRIPLKLHQAGVRGLRRTAGFHVQRPRDPLHERLHRLQRRRRLVRRLGEDQDDGLEAQVQARAGGMTKRRML